MTARTEEDAAKVWCPQSGLPHGGREKHNCIGNGCAMWRWATFKVERAETHREVASALPPTPEGKGWKRDMTKEQTNYTYHWFRLTEDGERGYCGLGGPDS